MYFIVTCIRLYITLLYGVHTAVTWEMQVGAFMLATHFGHYHTILRMSLTNRNCFVKYLLMT